MEQLTVLHVIGSTESEFYFEVSMLYGKAACTFPGQVKALYGITRPNGMWFFFEDSIDNVEVRDITQSEDKFLNKIDDMEGTYYPVLSLEKFLAKINAKCGEKGLDLVVPHMFDQSGLTSFRGFLEDVLKVTVAGPDLFSNVVAQNKNFTRGVLMSLGVPMAKGVVIDRPVDTDNNEYKEELVDENFIENELLSQLQPPFIVKPPLEDNSRGISLVKNLEGVKSALLTAFSFGEQALIEEFIPGREFRCGCIEYDGKLRPLPSMIEYAMNDPDMPIRTSSDKLRKDEDGGMRQVKKQETKCPQILPAQVDDETRIKLEQITMLAHRVLRCRDYSLFDFRVHSETGQPYVIEACAFWSFSSLSMISRMLDAGGEDYREVILATWRSAAKRTYEKREKLRELGYSVAGEPGNLVEGNDSDMSSTAPPSSDEDTLPPVESINLTEKSVDEEERVVLLEASVSTVERMRCVAHILILVLSFPLLMGYATREYAKASLLFLYRTLCSLFVKKTKQIEMQVNGSPDSEQKKLTVLVTGGKMAKSLHIARCLWRNGHRVVMVETQKYWCSGSRSSRSVSAFEIVRCPRQEPEGYMDDLVRIAQCYGCDAFIPVSSPAAAQWDARVKPRMEKVGCNVLHFSEKVCEIFDDKHKFGLFCGSTLGMSAVPETFCLKSNQEVMQLNASLLKAQQENKSKKHPLYILKNLEYDPVHRLDLFKMPCKDELKLKEYLTKIEKDGNGICEAKPWQAQRFLNGPEYTAFAILRNGKPRMLTIALSSASQLRYQHVEVEPIREWVEEFCGKLQKKYTSSGQEHSLSDFTGQLCWDFIVDGDEAYPIECNPRIHSQGSVFASHEQQKDFGVALLRDVICDNDISNAENNELLTPVKKVGVTTAHYYGWILNEVLYHLTNLFGEAVLRYDIANPEAARGWYLDADFDVGDPLPYFSRSLFQPIVLFMDTLWAGNEWKKYDFCIGKVVEKNGD